MNTLIYMCVLIKARSQWIVLMGIFLTMQFSIAKTKMHMLLPVTKQQVLSALPL